MAKLVFAMNLSLDGYVDHEAFGPGPELFQHWIDVTRASCGSIYGRGLYELMRYWDEEDPGWTEAERAFAEAWRAQPKWVVSHSLTSVGPNATLVAGDLEATVRKLKAELEGEIDLGGPKLAYSLGELGLIDSYRLYYHPVVLGQGTPLFPGARPPLRLEGHERISEDVVRLSYAPT